MGQRQNLLLLEDVDDLGRSGDVVLVKAGFCRNFLLPQKKAVIADKNTLRMQEKLKKERAVKAIEDKKTSEELAQKIQGISLEIKVKVDPEGKMYGSVSSTDIVELLKKEMAISLEKRYVQLKRPLKEIGVFDIALKLKEDVEAIFHLKIIPEEAKEEVPKV